jgi:hypothetical protein
MRALTSVDVSIVGLAGTDALTDESMYDEVSGRPSFTTRETAEFFFGHPRSWLYEHVRRGHLELDAAPVEIPYRASGLEFRWRLVDVERTAIGLAQGGYLDAPRLFRALSIVRLVAENYGYLVTEVQLRTVEHDPHRTELAAIQTEEVITDDLSGEEGAAERRFALGDIEYRIDLTDASWARLRELLAPYIQAARTTYRKASHPRSYGGLRAVRAWAREHGYSVSDTGPLPHAVTDAYLREQSS